MRIADGLRACCKTLSGLNFPGSDRPELTRRDATFGSRRRQLRGGSMRFCNGLLASQRIRKRVEEIFGWMKTVGGFRRTRYRGQARTQLAGYLVAAAYNLVRMTRLIPKPATG